MILLALLFPVILRAETIRVLEIDTGVDLSHAAISAHVHEKVPNFHFMDDMGHGTHIAGLILQNTCQEVELLSCRVYNGPMNEKEIIQRTLNCFSTAIKNKVDIINYSSSGGLYYQKEYDLLKQISDSGTKIVVAAGNEGKNLQSYNSYPAKYKLRNLIPVGNKMNNGIRHPTSNYGLKNMVWEYGTNVYSTLPNVKFGRITGTSQATAIHTNRLLLEMCRKIHDR